ncbi:MAG: hypothetical protein HQM10_20575 [Candidatus Riflebacteria bacterium]|nr:hypothetical protein [Candidatus Riflebacteria bacterium]
MENKESPLFHCLSLIIWVSIMAFFFAEVEIQIEGGSGWAASLPTWRIEKHWLLDIFWGGRPMTGYHAWVFSFMFLSFHLGVFLNNRWTWRFECMTIASLMYFWIIEDFLWFVFNPHFGMQKFNPANIPWHKSWLFGVPTDYVTFLLMGSALLFASFYKKSSQPPNNT